MNCNSLNAIQHHTLLLFRISLPSFPSFCGFCFLLFCCCGITVSLSLSTSRCLPLLSSWRINNSQLGLQIRVSIRIYCATIVIPNYLLCSDDRFQRGLKHRFACRSGMIQHLKKNIIIFIIIYYHCYYEKLLFSLFWNYFFISIVEIIIINKIQIQTFMHSDEGLKDTYT